MSDIFKHNSLNLVVSSLAILCAYYLGFGSLLFWFGGLLIIPAIAIWFQFKYSLGNLIERLVIAVTPWLVLCCVGLLWASKTEHEGQRTMNMLFFEMPLYSIFAGCVVVVVWSLIKKLRLRS